MQICLVLNRMILLLFVVATLSALAQEEPASLEDQIRMEYEGRTLVLRGFYEGKDLRYDAEGNLRGQQEAGPWTLTGKVRIRKVSLKDNRLELDAERMHVRYHSDNDTFEERPRGKVEIAIEKGRNDSAGLKQALRRVFIHSAEEFEANVPELWRPFLRWYRERGREASADSQESFGGGQLKLVTKDGEQVHKVGDGISSPVSRFCPDPPFTDVARKARYNGAAIFRVVVNSRGEVEGATVLGPAGLGLDEEAARVLLSWRFSPALRDGQPIAVAFAVEVSYYLD